MADVHRTARYRRQPAGFQSHLISRVIPSRANSFTEDKMFFIIIKINCLGQTFNENMEDCFQGENIYT